MLVIWTSICGSRSLPIFVHQHDQILSTDMRLDLQTIDRLFSNKISWVIFHKQSGKQQAVIFPNIQ